MKNDRRGASGRRSRKVTIRQLILIGDSKEVCAGPSRGIGLAFKSLPDFESSTNVLLWLNARGQRRENCSLVAQDQHNLAGGPGLAVMARPGSPSLQISSYWRTISRFSPKEISPKRRVPLGRHPLHHRAAGCRLNGVDSVGGYYLHRYRCGFQHSLPV